MIVVLFGLEPIQPGQLKSYKKNNKYQLLYTYGCTTWWWA